MGTTWPSLFSMMAQPFCISMDLNSHGASDTSKPMNSSALFTFPFSMHWRHTSRSSSHVAGGLVMSTPAASRMSLL